MLTNQKHWLDFVLWPFLRILWEPIFRKRSYFWHWLPYSGHYAYWITAKGDPLAKPRKTLFAQFWQTSFGWKKVVILKPKGNYIQFGYRIGFAATENGKRVKQLCSIILHGPYAVLVGPDDVSFFAVRANNGIFIPIEVQEGVTRATLPKNIPLI